MNARSPWNDGATRPFTPRDVIAGVTGGFAPDLAAAVLADGTALAYANRYLTRYIALAGHLPHPYESRVARECADPTPEGDADLTVALAIGYGVPDEAFDELARELDDWDGTVTMGAGEPVPAGVGADRFAPVLLGGSGTGGTRSLPPESAERWDVEFSSQRCRVRVRRERADGTLALRVDMPEQDGMHRLVLRFADGPDMAFDIDVRRGVWRRGGVAATGLPVSVTIS